MARQTKRDLEIENDGLRASLEDAQGIIAAALDYDEIDDEEDEEVAEDDDE